MLFVVLGPPEIDQKLDDLNTINNVQVQPGIHLVDIDVGAENEKPAETARDMLNLGDFTGDSVVMNPNSWAGWGSEKLLKRIQAIDPNTHVSKKAGDNGNADQPGEKNPEGD